MIDIIVCFCDKDYNLIDNFIKSINLSLDYNLIFVDDRINKSLDLSSFRLSMCRIVSNFIKGIVGDVKIKWGVRWCLQERKGVKNANVIR